MCYEELARRLLGLVIGLEGRIPAEQTEWLHEVTRMGEYGLALDDMAAILAHHDIAISDQERADMLALAAQMDTSGQVSAALSRCPQAGDSGLAADKASS